MSKTQKDTKEPVKAPKRTKRTKFARQQSMENQSTRALLQMIKDGTLRAAAAKYELRRRGITKFDTPEVAEA